jgi:isopentenyl-diphosphate Delta-isomerase
MNDALESVILVDAQDRALGTAPKLDAHVEGRLHRAFSVLIDDGDGNMLLQRRAAVKYHSGGLWTNACCGHPRPGEDTARAALRRLREEMGFVCELAPIGTLTYRDDVGDALIEHEFVHLFRGRWAGSPHPDPREIDACEWRPCTSVRRDVVLNPHRFTAWFRRYISLPAFADGCGRGLRCG